MYHNMVQAKRVEVRIYLQEVFLLGQTESTLLNVSKGETMQNNS